MDGQIDGRINRWMDRYISLKDRRLDRQISNLKDGLIYEYIINVDPDPHSFGSVDPDPNSEYGIKNQELN